MVFPAWLRQRFQPLTLGERGEKYAARYLRRLGYKILLTRHRQRYGEIDILAVEDQTVVFVEVKTRRKSARSRPADAVTATKRKRLLQTVDRYMRLLGNPMITHRLDIVEVIYNGRSLVDLRYWPDEIREQA